MIQIVEEEHQKLVKKNGKEERVKRYLRLLRVVVMIIIKCMIARLSALWELIRGFIIGFTMGPYYREGWLLIGFRIFGLLLPGVANHNPQDYVNATMLATEDLFKYYPSHT